MARRVQQPKKRRTSLFTIGLLSVLILAMGIMLQNMQTQLRNARAEQEIYAQRLAILQETNGKLSEAIANSDDPELIADIARNDLGMTSHGEKIFRFQY